MEKIMEELLSIHEASYIVETVKNKLRGHRIGDRTLGSVEESELGGLMAGERDRRLYGYLKSVENIEVADKSYESDLDYILESVVVVLEVLNDHYYKEDEKSRKPLVSDDSYDKLKFGILEKKIPDHRLFDKVGEDMGSGSEKFFQEEEHGFYDRAGNLVKSQENGSMNKIVPKDIIKPEDLQADSEGEKVEFDNASIKNFTSDKLVVSDKMDGITLVASYTKDKEKGLGHIERIYKHQVEYISRSSKSEREKQKILNYLKKQRNNLADKIKNVEDGNYFVYKIVTRGDGDIGEDITFNAMNAKGLVYEVDKKSVPEYEGRENLDFTIRGEAVITQEDFAKVPYKNPRNGVAMMRGQDGENTDLISWVPFEKIAYDFERDEVIHSDRAQMFTFFEENGFKCPGWKEFDSFEDAWSYRRERFKERADSNGYVTLKTGERVWTDGLICAIENAKKRVEKGRVSKKPKGETAFKPEPEVGLGEVESIDYTVGKTGLITPVIHLRYPVLISGTEVRKLTGANEEILNGLAPFKGAILEIVKRGEIIPKAEKNHTLEPLHDELEDFFIENMKDYLEESEYLKVLEYYHKGEIEVVFNKSLGKKLGKTVQTTFDNIVGRKRMKELLDDDRFKSELTGLISNLQNHQELFEKANEFKLVYPTECPSCGSGLQKGKVLVKCVNKGCEGISLARLTHFAQKLTKGIGEGTVVQLRKKGKLNSYSDYFKIGMEDFKDENGQWFEGWQEVSAERFMDSVNKIRKSKDNVFFGSLFFDGIGKGKFLKLFQDTSLAELLPQLNALTQTIPEDLTTEKDTLKKVLKKLEDIGYTDLEVFKKITSIGGFAHKGAEIIINTWVEEKEAINNLLETITLEPTKLVDKSVKRGTILLTGSVTYLPEDIKTGRAGSLRAMLKEYLEEKGYTVSSSVSSKTACVLAGDGATMHKVEKAQKMGIPVYDGEGFFENFNLGEDVSQDNGSSKGRHP